MFTGLAEKIPLDIFQSHEVEELTTFGVMPAFLWPGGRFLAAAFNARCCNGASYLLRRRNRLLSHETSIFLEVC